MRIIEHSINNYQPSNKQKLINEDAVFSYKLN